MTKQTWLSMPGTNVKGQFKMPRESGFWLIITQAHTLSLSALPQLTMYLAQDHSSRRRSGDIRWPESSVVHRSDIEPTNS